MNINLAEKRKNEIFDNFSNNQITLFVEKSFDNVFKSGEEEDLKSLKEVQEYFYDKDIFTAYSCLLGKNKFLAKRYSYNYVKDNINDCKEYFYMIFEKIIDFKTDVNILKSLFEVLKITDNSKLKKKIISIIEYIFLKHDDYKDDYKQVKLLEKEKENIIYANKTKREYIKEHEELKDLIEFFEFYNSLV